MNRKCDGGAELSPGDGKMTTDTEQDVEQRIRQRAQKIWEEEGRPEGRDKEHWARAAFAVTTKDAQQSTREAAEPSRTESEKPAESPVGNGIDPHLPHRVQDDTD